MPNENMLHQMRCPKCSNTRDFEVSANATVVVAFSAEGVAPQPPTALTFPDRGFCRCLACEHAGSTLTFRPLTVGSNWLEPREDEDSSCYAGTIVKVTATHVHWRLNLDDKTVREVEIEKFRRSYHSPSYRVYPFQEDADGPSQTT